MRSGVWMRTQVVVGVYMSRACHVVFFCHNLSIRHYTPILMYALLNYTPVTNTIRFIAASLWRLVMILMCPFGLLSVPVKILDLTAPHQSRKIFATTPLHKRLPFAHRSSVGELSSLLFSSLLTGTIACNIYWRTQKLFILGFVV
jgi:hypothetical protein